jgi:hypothetical protein
VRCDSGRARWCAKRCPQTTTASKRHCSIVVWLCSRSSDSVATRSARSLADSGLVSSIPTPIPIPTPIAVPNESVGDTQAKNLFSLFLHHHLAASKYRASGRGLSRKQQQPFKQHVRYEGNVAGEKQASWRPGCSFAFAKRQPAHRRSMSGLPQRRCRTRNANMALINKSQAA